jgi:hypothetical protein
MTSTPTLIQITEQLNDIYEEARTICERKLNEEALSQKEVRGLLKLVECICEDLGYALDDIEDIIGC